MDLRKYLIEQGIEPIEFALMMNISMTTLYRYLSKRGRPTYATAKLIEKFTKGKVTVKELRNE